MRSCEKPNIKVKMDEDNEDKKPLTLEFFPVKREPSPPRKYRRPNVNHEENAVPRVHNLQRQENAPIQTGFARVNDDQPRQVNANEIAVGQVVHGVIDTILDDGYLLTVRVGNSDNTLRGVVFKTGRGVPVAAGNDVAPNVPMIRRNEVSLPVNHLNQVDVHNAGSRERNEQHVNSNRNQIARLPVSRARHLPSVPSLPAHPVPKNNVMPPVLQPVNLPTGGTVDSNKLPVLMGYAPLESSKGKQVQNASTSNASKPTKQLKTVGNQVLFSPPTSNRGIPNFVSAEVPRPAGLNTRKSPCPPFENLPTVINGVHNPSQWYETQMNKLKNDNNGMDEPLAVEPLQTIPPDRIGPASLPKHY